MITRILTLILISVAVLRAEPVATALKPGDAVPDVALQTETGETVKLRELIGAKPTVLIFYRGGWCPYCQRHLQGLAEKESELLAAGAQLLAISMDQPAKLLQTPDRAKLPYRLLSDADAVVVKAFGIAFTVDDKTIAQLKSYHIDIETASGRTHHILPHPAVFVVGTDGVIRFAHTDTDYKVRLDPEKIVEAAKQAAMPAKKAM